jgi:hypothetical protein
MSSAVNDLQRAIVGGQQSLTQLLRQTKVIAANLNLQDVEKWVDLELDGYPQDIEPPKYREYHTHSLQQNNPYQGGWQFAGNLNIKVQGRQPISEIEHFSEVEFVAFPAPENIPLGDGLGGTFPFDFPQRFTVAGTQFKRIVDSVLNELLKITTELQKRGIKGENMDFNEQEKQKAGSIVYNIGTVHGAVGNVSNSPVTFYDNKTINQLFVDKNIPKQDRRELEDILDELNSAEPAKKKSLVARAEELIVKHKEALGATAEIIIKSVKAALE